MITLAGAVQPKQPGKVYFFESKFSDLTRYKQQLPDLDLQIVEQPLTADNAANFADAVAVSVFVRSKIDAMVLQKIPGLKFIATRSTGYDHIADKEVKAKGVLLANVPHYGENTVAEHTFALLLSLSRNVHKAYEMLKKGEFDINKTLGFDLKDKTLGVVGTGNIGMHVIRIAKGFGMNVLAFSRTQDNFLAEIMGYSYAENFADLLSRSDIITFHVPLTDQTRHMLNQATIAKLKPGAIVINTSRGAVIDDQALYDALKSGQIGGAGLDVIEGEEAVIEDLQLAYQHSDQAKISKAFLEQELTSMDQVVFTPHIGFNSREALERIESESINNIRAFVSGHPVNLV
jgi:D-lactate dehydrogenase